MILFPCQVVAAASIVSSWFLLTESLERKRPLDLEDSGTTRTICLDGCDSRIWSPVYPKFSIGVVQDLSLIYDDSELLQILKCLCE